MLYWDKGTNFGDAIGQIVVEHVLNKKTMWVDRKYYPYPYLMSIGSILQKANENSIVWGSGFISESETLKQPPHKILAVRGPLTRQKLLNLNIDCPKIYGDPALILPEIYMPSNAKKKYKLGIIPHYIDQNSPYLNRFNNDKNILIIDIKNPDYKQFIDQVLSCEKIISSSLHGIITADAYKIPSLWIELSKNVKGNGFKFFDYFESVNKKVESPYKFTHTTTLNDLNKYFSDFSFIFDTTTLKNVLTSYYNQREEQ
jgi:pyruvyltransferase